MNGTGITAILAAALLAAVAAAGVAGGASAQGRRLPHPILLGTGRAGGTCRYSGPQSAAAQGAGGSGNQAVGSPDLVAPATPGGAAGQVCAKADFEAVVDEAAGALRDLNMQNKPAFQEKLRQLKDKRGWSHDAFLKEAAPFVRDDKIAVYDQDSERLLTDISTLGQGGADAPTPDCALLAGLKARMQTLVTTQTAKWAYMFQKLDAALAQ